MARVTRQSLTDTLKVDTFDAAELPGCSKGALAGKPVAVLQRANLECQQVSQLWQEFYEAKDADEEPDPRVLREIVHGLFCIDSAVRELEMHIRTARIQKQCLPAAKLDAIKRQVKYLRQFEKMSRLKLDTLGIDSKTGETTKSGILDWIYWIGEFLGVTPGENFEGLKLDFLLDLVDTQDLPIMVREDRFETLLRRNYVITDVLGDGNCMLHAILAEIDPGKNRQDQIRAATQLRQRLADTVVAHASEFDQGRLDANGKDIIRDRNFRDPHAPMGDDHDVHGNYVPARDYASAIRPNGVWLDYEAVYVLSNYVLHRPIHVINARTAVRRGGHLEASPLQRYGEDQPGEPIYLYHTGNHYLHLSPRGNQN